MQKLKIILLLMLALGLGAVSVSCAMKKKSPMPLYGPLGENLDEWIKELDAYEKQQKQLKPGCSLGSENKDEDSDDDEETPQKPQLQELPSQQKTGLKLSPTKILGAVAVSKTQSMQPTKQPLEKV